MKRLLLILMLVLLAVPTLAQQEATCSTTGRDIEGETGAIVSVSCPADCTTGSLWGSDIYTDDFSVCTAAVHAGALTAEGGVVDVTILDGEMEYASTEQNGVTSSSWGAWTGSFGFGTSDVIAFSCFDVTVEGAESGDVYEGSCPAGCSEGSLWGTGIYTNDFTICTAAAHAGAISLADGGSFTLVYLDGQDEYPASEQNGISSSSWGSWDLSFGFTQEIACGQGTIEGADVGSSYVATCSAGCSAGSIWGTDVYTDDSDICTAAAHAGVISLEDGGTFVIDYSEGLDEYPESEQNGISSSSWGSWSLSFSVSPVGLSGEPIECATRANEFEGDAGTSFAVTCPAGCSAGSVWGSETYTDDSSICTAAAHAGVISLEDGGTFNVNIVDGLEDHPGSEANGITTSDWGSWSRSFTVGN